MCHAATGLKGRLCWQNAMPVASNTQHGSGDPREPAAVQLCEAYPEKDRKWAFWGHGRNFPGRFTELVERAASNAGCPAMWTGGLLIHRLSSATVAGVGLSPASGSRCSIMPSTPTELDRADRFDRSEETEQARRELGIGPGPIGLSLASLHADKRLRLPVRGRPVHSVTGAGFSTGDGGRWPAARSGTEGREGSRRLDLLAGCAERGATRRVLLSISQLMLNPGMVGLSVLDSLVAGTPMVTTAYPHHSPEIVYLHSGQNGLMTDNDVASFVEGVLRLAGAPGPNLNALQAGCRIVGTGIYDRKNGGQFLERHPGLPVGSGKGKYQVRGSGDRKRFHGEQA